MDVIRTINRCILASFAVMPLKYRPTPIEFLGNDPIELGILFWGCVAALTLAWWLKR